MSNAVFEIHLKKYCNMHSDFLIVNFIKLFFHDVSSIDGLTNKAMEKIGPEGRTYHQVPEGPSNAMTRVVKMCTYSGWIYLHGLQVYSQVSKRCVEV